MRGLLSSLLATATLLTCGCLGPGPSRDLSQRETDDVLETVYRYQLAHDERPEVAGYCLCTPADSRQGGDTSPELLAKFTSEPRPVLTCSACALEEGRIFVQKSGKTAETFYIASVRPLFSGEIEVEGGARTSRFVSTRLRYRVVRSGTGFKVTDALGPQMR